MQVSRRNFIKLAGSGLAVASCAPSIAIASYPDLARSLALSNVHTGELLETRYFDGSKYLLNEMTRIDKICRDFRRNEVHKMDKHLFDQISLIQAELGVEAEVQIISGYRSPATNNALRARSSGVAKKSYHMLGQAIDFRLDGVNLKKVRDIAREIKAGGVGYYPSSGFIHVDTGPVRYWS
ncbi:DUF882 domain-containing protein [Vibrio kasasachensis]|uniref:DUF882 domain-containing protein n=1 Tax=Vibrio kasasachensis TaxID=2910248 RepID=UPI003D104EB4